MTSELRKILEGVQAGTTSVDEALGCIKAAPFVDLGYAKVDLHRQIRQGAAEVIYGASKTPEQIEGIVSALEKNGQKTVIVTRMSKEAAEYVSKSHVLSYHTDARLGTIGPIPVPNGLGTIAVITGGTSDIPVAEEAALTAEALGNRVDRIYDVGVAGIHRLLAQTDRIQSASVIIAVAGMEGALASVVGGLTDCPVIAVPTSVGYGASFGGLAALLAMVNSCASGITVVNIDNGFGAGFFASRVNHMGEKK